MYKCYTIFLNQNFTRNPIKQKRIQNFDGKPCFQAILSWRPESHFPFFCPKDRILQIAKLFKKITQNLSIISVRPSFMRVFLDSKQYDGAVKCYFYTSNLYCLPWHINPSQGKPSKQKWRVSHLVFNPVGGNSCGNLSEVIWPLC